MSININQIPLNPAGAIELNLRPCDYCEISWVCYASGKQETCYDTCEYLKQYAKEKAMKDSKIPFNGGQNITYRELIKHCPFRYGEVIIDVQPMNHSDKLAKHLNADGKITMNPTGCQHPNKINDYCSSECPHLNREDIEIRT